MGCRKESAGSALSMGGRGTAKALVEKNNSWVHKKFLWGLKKSNCININKSNIKFYGYIILIKNINILVLNLI